MTKALHILRSSIFYN